MTKLPEDLAPFVLEFAGPGISVYAKRGYRKVGLAEARLDELVTDGWLTKSSRYFDSDDEEHDVEQDEEGSWWCEGESVRYEDICFSYLTTEKTHDSDQAMRAQLERYITRAQASCANACELAKKVIRTSSTLNSGVRDADAVREVRAELAFLALTVEAPLLLLEAWRTQLKERS